MVPQAPQAGLRVQGRLLGYSEDVVTFGECAATPFNYDQSVRNVA
jgi:hypothetical protein